VGLIDFFLPFMPLEASHLRELLRRGLEQRGAALAAGRGVALAWDARLEGWLLERVELDGPYPLEGAKQVENLLTRHTARILRRCCDGGGPGSAGGAAGVAGADVARRRLTLRVSEDGRDVVGDFG
jgi:hypothetical protein